MKKIILLFIITFNSILLSGQSTSPSRSEINQINLRLDKIEKFGNLHRTGNHLIISETVLSGIGSLIIFRNSMENYDNDYNSPDLEYKKYKYKRTERLGFTIIGIGSALATAGIVVNLDSFRQFKKQ